MVQNFDCMINFKAIKLMEPKLESFEPFTSILFEKKLSQVQKKKHPLYINVSSCYCFDLSADTTEFILHFI